MINILSCAEINECESANRTLFEILHCQRRLLLACFFFMAVGACSSRRIYTKEEAIEYYSSKYQPLRERRRRDRARWENYLHTLETRQTPQEIKELNEKEKAYKHEIDINSEKVHSEPLYQDQLRSSDSGIKYLLLKKCLQHAEGWRDHYRYSEFLERCDRFR